MRKRLLFAVFAVVAGASTLLTGCVPLVVAGAVGGTALVATDRRSVGAQADDEAIELKIAQQHRHRATAIACTSTSRATTASCC